MTKRKKTVLILALWAIILNFHSPAKAGEGNKKARLLYENALEVYSEEDFPAALRLLDKVITAYSGISYEKKSAYLLRLIIQYKLSLRELKKLSNTEFSSLNPGLIKGIIYQREGEKDKAFAEFQAILLNPELKRWRFWAKEMIQSSEWNRNIWEKDRHLAIKMYEVMLEAGDDSVAQKLRIYERLASLYARKRDYDGAIKTYREMIELDPHRIHSYNQLGRMYAKKHDRKNALIVWMKMTEINTDINTLAAAAQNFKEYNFLKEAERAYGELIKTVPSNVHYRTGLAEVYRKQRLYAKSVAEYKKAIERADHNNRKWIENALLKVYKEAGMIKTRAKEKEDVLAITDEKLLGAYRKTALSYEKLKQYEKAKEMYGKALELSPQDKGLKKSLERVEMLINKTGR